jgi:hypothetical protein
MTQIVSVSAHNFDSHFLGLTNAGVQNIDSLMNTTNAPNVTLTSRGKMVPDSQQLSPNFNQSLMHQQLSPNQQRNSNAQFSSQNNQSKSLFVK